LRVIETVNKDKRPMYKVSSLAEEGHTDSRDIDTPWKTFFPPTKLCTDNGVMVAWTGVEMLCQGVSSPVHIPSTSTSICEEALPIELMEPIPRWPLGPHVNRNNDVVFRKRVKRL
jgi:hypothetical protein